MRQARLYPQNRQLWRLPPAAEGNADQSEPAGLLPVDRRRLSPPSQASLVTLDLNACTEFAHSLADLARPIARRYFASGYHMATKADDSPVTQADTEIESAICDAIRQQYPEHGIYGEESGQQDIDREWVWVIDPIDGTKAFIAGKQTFTTLIALCQRGVPVLGIIDQPIKEERWCGVSGTATRFNGEPVSVAPCDTLTDAVLATTSIPYFTATQAIGFRRLEQATGQTLLNHDAYAYGMLAKGEADIVIESGLKPYDVCALIPVVEGAGGIITDWQGDAVTMHSAGDVIAAGNKLLHTEVLSLLHNHP